MAAQPRPRPPPSRRTPGPRRERRDAPDATDAARGHAPRSAPPPAPCPATADAPRRRPRHAWDPPGTTDARHRPAPPSSAAARRAAPTPARCDRSPSPAGRQTGRACSTPHPRRAEIVRRLQFAADHARRNTEMPGRVLQWHLVHAHGDQDLAPPRGHGVDHAGQGLQLGPPIAWRAGPGFWSTSSSTSRSSSVPLRWRCSERIRSTAAFDAIRMT